ncbi:hypothetical protein Ga0466249_004552 [Sporomusaceae bacterium BoRhaA]|uniref:contractile injection system protein, VgrG/Pvc8 family n=1 Tax=Pelorhabdus rhamnosifermentans TaxID=2772457 RepID=UPI001C060253|nr:contractile injection system protein, VgrG/Pvc8 family [Pelorhabdus rhamnosifermentans]MBU2703407.1 hypothetical protein [Pelorhabdus rhamnosifermentans]
MAAISYDKIKVISPWEIQSIYDLKITNKLNQHGELQLTALISEESGKRAGLQETVTDQIKVIIIDGNNTKAIFTGRLKDVDISVKAGLYNLQASALSESSIMDEEKKSRSFQNTNLNYSDIVQIVTQDYSGKSFELTADKAAINGPIIQYQETDWQFIKRMASLMETVIAADGTVEDRIFSFGYPKGKAITLSKDIAYTTGKNIKAFYEDVSCNSKLNSNEYAYYVVESHDELNIGDQVTFLDNEMYVGAVIIELIQGLVVYRATLVRKMTLRQNPIYNSNIQGVSLEGTVLDLQDQSIKLHLNIDKEQNPDEAYWYSFVPPTTDMMYLMPQLNTNASLYIPGLREQDAIITGCVRTNGASCEDTSDPNDRFLGTEYGQELKITPDGIYITAGRDDLILTLDDEKGVNISSHKGIVMEAKEEIILKSKKKVVLRAPSQVLMNTPASFVSMENEMYFRAPNVHVNDG